MSGNTIKNDYMKQFFNNGKTGIYKAYRQGKEIIIVAESLEKVKMCVQGVQGVYRFMNYTLVNIQLFPNHLVIYL